MSKQIKEKAEGVASGSTFLEISGKLLGKLEIMVPNKREQDEIAKLFENIDNLITLHQRKLELLTQLKKAYLQRLFPRTGQKLPEIRFANFQGDWIRCKLGDILSIPKKEKLTNPTVDKILTVGLNLKGIRKGGNRDTLKMGATAYYIRKEGQLIYGKQNFFNGSIAIVPKEMNGLGTSTDVPGLDIDPDVDSLFLYTYISRASYYQEKENLASGTGSKRIHEKTLFEFTFTRPIKEEQQSISSFFSAIQTAIEVDKRNLSQLQNYKKSLLNKLFI